MKVVQISLIRQMKSLPKRQQMRRKSPVVLSLYSVQYRQSFQGDAYLSTTQTNEAKAERKSFKDEPERSSIGPGVSGETPTRSQEERKNWRDWDGWDGACRLQGGFHTKVGMCQQRPSACPCTVV